VCIVIVDDNRTNLIVLKHLAKGNADRPVYTFASSLEARDYLKDSDADIIIVDCDMPNLNGIEFTKVVRSFLRHKSTPIVMVTSHSEDKVREAAISAGVTDFLTKPVNPEEFRGRVRNLLRLTA
jgi:CheY-like chemotaxis protein